MVLFKLGDDVRDPVTGVIAKITGVADYLDETTKYRVEWVSHDGTAHVRWWEAGRLQLI